MRARQIVKRGFTLVETVVTVGIIGALAAVVYPTVVKQFDSADPTRGVEDLNSIRTGIETFAVNIRPQQPHELDDLTIPLVANTAPDSTALGALYSAAEAANWKGPYLGVSIPAGSLPSAAVITTGFGGSILNRLPLFDVDIVTPVGGDTVVTSASANAEFVAVIIKGLSGAAFNSLNLLIDGPTEATAAQRRSLGRLRCPYAGAPAAVPGDAAACVTAYYLATPLRR